MRQFPIVAWTVLAFAMSAAFAHNESLPGKQPAVDAATQPPGAAGTRDPKIYFTDAELVTQDGLKIRFYSDMLKGKAVVLNVMYTNCTEACPLITTQLTQVRDDLGNLFGNKISFISMTSDPVRDTPQTLKKFARLQNADVAGWTFLTGRKNDIDLILKRLGALSENVEEHATVLYILDVDNKRMRRMLPNLPPKAIAEAARSIAFTDRQPVPGAVLRAN